VKIQEELGVIFVFKKGNSGKRVVQGGLWHGSRMEKIEDHGSQK